MAEGQPVQMNPEEVNYDSLPANRNSIPLVAAVIPLCAAQMMGTRHMRGQVMRLLRDPHVWLPWKNRNPWKNPVGQWWHNANPWINYNPWKNANPWHPVTGQKIKLTDVAKGWKNPAPWKNPSPWTPPAGAKGTGMKA